MTQRMVMKQTSKWTLRVNLRI